MATKREQVISLLVSTNMSQQEIAREVGVHGTTISKWKKDPDFQAMLEEAQWQFLGDLARPAIRVLRESLQAKNEQIRFQAAKDILDRTGYKPIDKQEITGNLDISEAADRYRKYLEDDD